MLCENYYGYVTTIWNQRPSTIPNYSSPNLSSLISTMKAQPSSQGKETWKYTPNPSTWKSSITSYTKELLLGMSNSHILYTQQTAGGFTNSLTGKDYIIPLTDQKMPDGGHWVYWQLVKLSIHQWPLDYFMQFSSQSRPAIACDHGAAIWKPLYESIHTRIPCKTYNSWDLLVDAGRLLVGWVITS